MLPEPIVQLLERAMKARAEGLLNFPDLSRSEQMPHDSAFRLFNGFLEGYPDLVIDLYANTLVIFNHAENVDRGFIERLVKHLIALLPWVQAVVVKTRNSALEQERRGVLAYGLAADRKIRENGTWYSVDLTLNLDASFYLDTRNLRAWATRNLTGKRVLNTFAYTGSLGVAAVAGGANQVMHLDLNPRFLNLAKESYALNRFPVQRKNFLAGDFWVLVNQLKRTGELFDCVFVDPPFFSVTGRGKVDLLSQSQRVINKVRPLVGHGGYLVVINNALFLSGKQFTALLEALCADGYLAIEKFIPVPPDFTGFPETRVSDLPVDPSPFNHSTKIAVLRATRKDERTA